MNKACFFVFLNLVLFILSDSMLAQGDIESFKDIESTIKSFKEKKDSTKCFNYREQILAQANLKKDKVVYAGALLATNNCLFASRDFTGYLNVVAEAKSLLDSSQHYHLYRKANLQLLNYFSFRDRVKAKQLLIDFARLDSLYGSNEQYFESVRSLISTLLVYGEHEEAAEKALNTLENPNIGLLSTISIKNTLARCYEFTDKQKALDVYEDALQDAEVHINSGVIDSVVISSLYRDYGNIKIAQGEINEAISALIVSLDLLVNNIRFSLSRIHLYRNLGQLFMITDNLARSREYMDQATGLAELMKYKMRNGLLANANGQLLEEEGKPEEAKKEYLNAIEYFKKWNKKAAVVESYSLIAHLYLKEGDLAAAKKYRNEIRELYPKEDLMSINPHYTNFEAAYFEANGILPRAKLIFEQLEEQSKRENKPKHLSIAYAGIQRTSYKLNDYKNAYTYQSKLNAINDSLYRMEQQNKLIEIEAKYNRSEQDAQIALLDKETQLKTAQLKQRNIYMILGGLGLVLLSFFAFLFYNLFKKVNKQNVIIEKALSDKEVLLKEIHHRVKNNLQLVSSLLTLQSREIQDENAIEAINAGKARVRSMALIHQDLYSNDNLKGISAVKYLRNLCNELFHTYHVSEDQIKLDLDIQDVNLDIDSVVPIGLIINELVTNSLKHAFDESKEGTLFIKLFEENSKLKLTIADNGKGMNPDLFKSTNSFGNKLIYTLMEQLDGDLRITSEGGTKFDLSFAEYKLAS
jgi:two-component sensor histidine kinase